MNTTTNDDPKPIMTNAQAVRIDALRTDIEHGLLEKGIPRHMWNSILRYVMHGVPLPEFLHAVFANDLMQAVAKADDLNRERLRDYAVFMTNHLPIHCYQSAAAVRLWTLKGGLIGEAVAHAAPRAPSVEG